MVQRSWVQQIWQNYYFLCLMFYLQDILNQISERTVFTNCTKNFQNFEYTEIFGSIPVVAYKTISSMFIDRLTWDLKWK